MGAIAPLTIEIETQSPKQVMDITGRVDAMLDAIALDLTPSCSRRDGCWPPRPR